VNDKKHCSKCDEYVEIVAVEYLCAKCACKAGYSDYCDEAVA